MRRHKKGKNGELELMHIFRDDYGYNVRRGYVACNEPDVVGLNGIHVEVKRREHIDISGWMAQAITASDRHRDGLPTVFHRESRKKWLVTMLYADWVSLGGESHTDNYHKQFNLRVEMEKAKENGADALRYTRQVGELVTMYLTDWIDLYGARPFTE